MTELQLYIIINFMFICCGWNWRRRGLYNTSAKFMQVKLIELLTDSLSE